MLLVEHALIVEGARNRVQVQLKAVGRKLDKPIEPIAKRHCLSPIQPFVGWRTPAKLVGSAMPIEPDSPVIMFYLAIEPFRGGFRWLVRQYGAAAAIEIGNEAFATEAEARKSGRRALIGASARAPVGGRRGRRDFDLELVGRPSA